MKKFILCHGGLVERGQKNYAYRALCLSIILVAYASCSWVSKSRRSAYKSDVTNTEQNGDDAKLSGSKDYVTKSQYEDLLRRYEDVNRKYLKQKEMLGDTPPSINNSTTNTNNLADSVDVFSNGQENAKLNRIEIDTGKNTKPIISDVTAENEVAFENEIVKIRKAVTLLHNKQFDKAMEHLQKLEQSRFKQIRVRAKFNIAQLLMGQKEFDLALQVFEEILQQYAFSGMILESLEGIVVCANQLKLEEKKSKYSSLLRDIFKRP